MPVRLRPFPTTPSETPTARRALPSGRSPGRNVGTLTVSSCPKSHLNGLHGKHEFTDAAVAVAVALHWQRHWPVAKLADRLEVSVRTLRRDCRPALRAGLPVEGARGVDGGYPLTAGAPPPPLALDDEGLSERPSTQSHSTSRAEHGVLRQPARRVTHGVVTPAGAQDSGRWARVDLPSARRRRRQWAHGPRFSAHVAFGGRVRHRRVRWRAGYDERRRGHWGGVGRWLGGQRGGAGLVGRRRVGRAGGPCR